MAFLVIGLGSMGKRRIRCLQALGHTAIYGYDIREDRRKEAADAYGINVSFCESPDVVFICLPPKLHNEYATRYKSLPCFVEAGTQRLDHGCPSNTFMYHPQVQEIQRELPTIGKLVNISYHSGQYLPDWHPYEKICDYYAGATGAKEMLPFELMWFTQLFGHPNQWEMIVRRGKEIDGLIAPDTIAMLLGQGYLVATFLIDVVSRTPTRQIIINGTEKQLRYDLNEGVSEQMYIDETKAFLDGRLLNSLEHNNAVVRILEQIA